MEALSAASTSATWGLGWYVVGVGVRLAIWWCHGRVGVVGGCVVLPEYTRIETLVNVDLQSAVLLRGVL